MDIELNHKEESITKAFGISPKELDDISTKINDLVTSPEKNKKLTQIFEYVRENYSYNELIFTVCVLTKEVRKFKKK